MHRTVLFVAAWNFSCAVIAQVEPVTASADIGRNIGMVRAELKLIEKAGDGITFSEIRLFHRQATVPFQRIAVNVSIDNPFFEFIDLNGDGYKDMLFYGTCGSGYQCRGPSPHAADVFIIDPERRRFDEVGALSGRGKVHAAPKKGCATVDYKSGPQGYTTETWCVGRHSGEWKLKSQVSGEPLQ